MRKEHKGGIVTNEEIEKDLAARGGGLEQNGYRGTQDTGDKHIRSMGTEVQKRDGQALENKPTDDEKA